MRTSGDLYRFVTALRVSTGSEARSLEDYLAALWELASARRGDEVLELAAFAELLEAALSAEAPSFNPRWRPTTGPRPDGGYERWDWTIREQIVDLHEMQAAGTLANELRYFGIQAPGGARWFNFDPAGFLECAVAGSFQGWDDADAAAEVIEAISWDGFADFLRAGQLYE